MSLISVVSRRLVPCTAAMAASGLLVFALAACQASDTPASGPEGAPAAAEPTAADSAPAEAITDTSGGAAAEAVPPADLVADVNGSPITLAEFQRQAFDTQRFYVDKGVNPNTDDGQRQLLFLRRQVLDDMINQKLMEQAAEELNMTVSDAELQASIDDTVSATGGQAKFDETLAQTGSSLEEFRRMQASALIGKKMMDEVIAKDVPTTAEARHARHILCQTEAECQAALGRVEGGEDFATVATAVSADEGSKQQGGDLGWVWRGGLVTAKEVEDAIFGLEAGKRSLVKSELGYHVVEVIEVDPARPMPDELLNNVKSRKLIDWFTERRKQAKITIYLDDLKDVVDGVGQPAGAAPPTP